MADQWLADDVSWYYLYEIVIEGNTTVMLDEVPGEVLCHECGPPQETDDQPGHEWSDKSPEIGDCCRNCGLRCVELEGEE